MLDALLGERVLVLAPNGAAWFVRTRWRSAVGSLVARQPLGEDDWLEGSALATRLGALVRAARGGPGNFRVLVSDRLCRMFMVSPPPNAARLGDLEASARARHAALYGATSGWKIEADWDPERPFVATAMPDTVISALGALKREAGVTAVRIQPNFVASANRLCRRIVDGEWFGSVEGSHLTLGAVNGASFVALRATTLATDVAESAQTFGRFIAQEALRMGVPAPSLLKLAGDVPAVWAGRAPARSGCVRLDSGTSAWVAMAEGRA